MNVFAKVGIEARYSITLGAPNASDEMIFDWAAENGLIIFTHDLDIAVVLAARMQRAPSIIQLRDQNITPDELGETVTFAVQRFAAELESGVLISIDAKGARARILPFRELKTSQTSGDSGLASDFPRLTAVVKAARFLRTASAAWPLRRG